MVTTPPPQFPKLLAVITTHFYTRRFLYVYTVHYLVLAISLHLHRSYACVLMHVLVSTKGSSSTHLTAMDMVMDSWGKVGKSYDCDRKRDRQGKANVYFRPIFVSIRGTALVPAVD